MITDSRLRELPLLFGKLPKKIILTRNPALKTHKCKIVGKQVENEGMLRQRGMWCKSTNLESGQSYSPAQKSRNQEELDQQSIVAKKINSTSLGDKLQQFINKNLEVTRKCKCDLCLGAEEILYQLKNEFINSSSLIPENVGSERT